jgi:hypothetical protein
VIFQQKNPATGVAKSEALLPKVRLGMVPARRRGENELTIFAGK